MRCFNAIQRSDTTVPMQNDSKLRIGTQAGLRETRRRDVESGAKVGRHGQFRAAGSREKGLGIQGRMTCCVVQA